MFLDFESTTLPIPAARIGSPISMGRMYDLAAFNQFRIVGSCGLALGLFILSFMSSRSTLPLLRTLSH